MSSSLPSNKVGENQRDRQNKKEEENTTISNCNDKINGKYVSNKINMSEVGL
jgi:hypothetical protein